MGSKSYQLTGEGTENEKRDEFDHFLSTADCVLRDTHAHYETLLDLFEDIPEDFVAERGVNVHLYQVLFLLASGAARRIFRTPALSTSRDGRKALVLLSAQLSPCTEREMRAMLAAIHDFKITGDAPPLPQAAELVVLRDRYSRALHKETEEIEFIRDFRHSLSFEYNNTHLYIQAYRPVNDLHGLYRRAHEKHELIVGRKQTDSHAFAAINPPEWRRNTPRTGAYAHPNSANRGARDGQRRPAACVY
jgi:hypothetical protein